MSASEAKIRDLNRQLDAEKLAHARTRNELQATIERVWRLVPSHYVSLMGVYPPLRKLLYTLTEAAALQDPSRGVSYEDTMRTEYTPDGETLTQTERGVMTHRRQRASVRQLNDDLAHLERYLADRVDRMARLVPGSAWEYQPPSGRCQACGKYLFQTANGRKREYCNATCRQRVSRNVTKRQPPKAPRDS